MIILFLTCKFTSLFIKITLSEKCLTKFFQIRNPNTSSGYIFPVVPFGILKNFISLFTGLASSTAFVQCFKIPKVTTGKIQPLDVFGVRIWKNFIRHFSDSVILINSDVNLLQSLVHNQLSSPRYINIFKQGWFKSNYIDKKPKKFDNPVVNPVVIPGCKNVAIIRCS